MRRVNLNDDEYFVNAGGTKQPGIEANVYMELIKLKQESFLRFVSLNLSYSGNKFTFSEYKITDSDFSGNKLTGVPENIFSASRRWAESIPHHRLHRSG